jgi:3-hydroxyisobutyrate dehydrogenase-like beta-hydroxyacid dehydrogenase
MRIDQHVDLLGRPVAANLLEAGVNLVVYNRTASKADALGALGAKVVSSPRETITPGGVVFTLLWDAQSVEDVVRSDGFLNQLGEGGLHISMSTISPDSARAIAALHDQVGARMISAPIFGHPEMAVAKSLTIMVSGSSARNRS